MAKDRADDWTSFDYEPTVDPDAYDVRPLYLAPPASDRIAELEAALRELRGALWFYADKNNWTRINGRAAPVEGDHCGMRARAALSSTRSDADG